MSNEKISVVINTLNSEQYLERVLRSVTPFDEIVICDMGSQDATLALAAQYHCHVVTHPPTGFVEPARNFAIQSATHPWVLVVDSDELVQPNLVTYLRAHVAKEHPEEGVRIPRKNYFKGRWMRSDYPDYTCRFFRKDAVDWPPYVHRQPKITGTLLTINRKRTDLAFIHLINPSITARLKKLEAYTNWELEKRANESAGFAKLIFAPWFRFVKSYILKGGFREGRAGYIHAKLDATYKFVTLAKMWEARTTGSESSDLAMFSESENNKSASQE